MGTKYSSQSTSGYNSSPPPDDGAQVAANLMTWAGVKTKLADVLKTFGEAINSALVNALDLGARAISSNDTAIASDHWRTLQVTGTTTISLSSAASMGSGYEVGVSNQGVGVVTVSPAGSDTINGVSSSITVPIKGTVVFRTNQALTGYNIRSQSNRQDAGNIDGAVIGAITPAAGTFTTVKASSTIGVGGTTPSGSGAGISFPATQSDSSDANTLDDYEEGTFTPSLGGTTTYTVQSGFYTKVGRIVHINGQITINVNGTGTDITGLPFTSNSNSNYQSLIALRFTSMTTATVGEVGRIGNSTTTISVFKKTAAAISWTAIAAGDYANGASIIFSGSYSI